jgi:phage FluMu gp28-like protein
VDVGRKKDLTVIDVEEKVGDVLWERMRIELEKMTFAEQEYEINRILALNQVKRVCMDSTGLGMQLAERAKDQYGWKVEPVTFTGPVKEDLAYPLRAAHEDRTIRYARDAKLRADLRGIRKETTASGNIRFVGESEDSHCDRFWAKALAVHAAKAPAVVPAAHCVES